MTLSKRTKISLAQFLYLFNRSLIGILFEKYDINGDCQNIEEIKDTLLNENTTKLIYEIIETKYSLRNQVSPRGLFDERWVDFEKCLLLDGYRIDDKTIIAIEPRTDGVQPIEDDLTSEILKSSLVLKNEIIKLINDSAEAFNRSPSDYNQCLSKVRISLETLIIDIANSFTKTKHKWGLAIEELKKYGFLEDKEVKVFTATYTFVSDGSHKPIGFTEEEYARFSRNLTLSTCYYVIKKFNTYNM